MLEPMPQSSRPKIARAYRGPTLPLRIQKDPLAYFENLSINNGSYTWLSLMGHRVLFLNDAGAIEQVFKGDNTVFHKGRYNDGVRPLLGKGVFLAEEELWRRQRRDSANVFQTKNFPEFVTQMDLAVESMLDRWTLQLPKNDQIDILQEMMWLTLDVVFRTLYHEDGKDTQEQMSVGLGTMLKLAEQRIWRPINLPLAWTLKRKRYSSVLSFMNGVVSTLVEARRSNAKYPDDLLSRLVEKYSSTAEDRKLLRDNVMSFLLAGHETTANGLAWTFLELGRRKDIRDQVINEAERCFDSSSVTFEQVKEQQLTLKVFQECLRLYPPVWTMSRETKEPCSLTMEDGQLVQIPKNTTIMLCAYTVQRREKYWSDPESFLPERFGREQTSQRPKCAWFPFGGGPRLCLGFRFAEVEAAIVLGKVFKRFNLSLLPGQKIVPEPIITLRPSRRVMFRISERTDCKLNNEQPHQDIVLTETDLDNETGVCPYKAA